MATIRDGTLERSPRRGGVVGPFLLIVIGIVLLLNTVGVWEWDVWATILRLWPLLFIAAGLDLLVGQNSLEASLLVALAALAMFAAGIRYVSSDLFVGGTLTEQVLNQDIGRAERAEVTLEGGVGTLRVTGASDSEKLVVGEIELARNEEVKETFDVQGDTAIYRLNIGNEGRIGVFPFWMRGNEKTWSIQLNNEIPMELQVNTGVGEAVLDLEELEITDLTLHTGVGQTMVTLSRSGEYFADIEAGVGEVTIRMPEGLAARIDVSTGLGAVDVRGDFERDGDSYVSPDWSRTENRVTLQVDAGVGSVNVISDR